METTKEVIKTETDLTSAKKTSRMSNFELLRIICMLLIVAHHFSVHSLIPSSIPTINTRILRGLAIGGKLAVNVYVLISGYFMVKSTFKLKKLFKLIFLTMFYSLTIYIIFCIFNFNSFSFSTFVKQIFPLYTGQYWFMSYFVVLYILSPFLNKLLNQCSLKDFVILIVLLLIIQTGTSNIYLGEMGWFITLYIVAAFIRIYPNKITDSNKVNLPIFITSFMLILITYMIWNINLWNMTNLVCFICSISLFCTFKNIHIKNSKFINLIYSSTLGIYLIHDNNLVRPILWNKWLNVPKYCLNNNFIIFSLISILMIFIICSIIDLIRQIIAKYIFKLNKKYKHF